MTKEYFCPKALSNMIGISTSTLAKWRVKGAGPKYYKCGNHRIRYKFPDVEEWMNRNGHDSTSF